MPRPKSDDSTEVVIRWRDRHETQIRVERLALFYDLSWNKLASGVLVGYASAQEKKYDIAQAGPADEMPRARYTSVASLPPLARARYDFYTAKLDALRMATSSDERAAIARREFVPEQWLTVDASKITPATNKGASASQSTAATRTKRKVAALPSTATIFRDVPLGDGPAGVPTLGEFRPASWGDSVRVKIKHYPGAAFALRVHGDSMTGVGIQSGDILVFAVPAAGEDLSGRVVAAHIEGGEVTIKTFVRRNGKTTLRAENPNHRNPIVTKNSAVQGVLVGKPIRQKRTAVN